MGDEVDGLSKKGYDLPIKQIKTDAIKRFARVQAWNQGADQAKTTGGGPTDYLHTDRSRGFSRVVLYLGS